MTLVCELPSPTHGPNQFPTSSLFMVEGESWHGEQTENQVVRLRPTVSWVCGLDCAASHFFFFLFPPVSSSTKKKGAQNAFRPVVLKH